MRFKDFETFYGFWNFNAYKCTVNAWITRHDSVQSQLQKQSLYKIWVLCTGQLDCFFNTSWLEQSVIFYMMASSNGNIFCVTGHLYGEFTGQRWVHRTKTSDAELWVFSLICVWINGWANNRVAGDLRRYRAHHDVIVMRDDISKCTYSTNVYHIIGLNTGPASSWSTEDKGLWLI